jgi:excisionase family DNA binding protein
MNNIKTTQRLLTPKEVADMLRVTVETLNVWRATKRYPLKYVKIGRNVLYKLDDVLAYIDSRTVDNTGGVNYAL